MSFSETAQILSHADRLSIWFANERRCNGKTYAAIITFVLLTWFVATIRGDTLLPYLAEYAQRILRSLQVFGSALVIGACSLALVKGRRGSPVGIAMASLGRLAMSTLIWRYLFACAVLALFLACFLYNKTMIPIIAPFQWDETFSRWDSILLGGHQPWQVIQPIVGTPWMTVLFDIMYSAWVPIVFLFWAGLLVSPRVPEPIRVRYWRATVMSWILIGLVMATLFSSAGPCYFADVVPGAPSPYKDLVEYLDEVAATYPLSSSLAKDMLWQIYAGQVDLPGGISAMPSMHNAQATLFAAVAYLIDRRFGHIMLAYAVLIFLGSIHLGWHYALDGIVGVGAALVIWWICGLPGPRRHPDQPHLADHFATDAGRESGTASNLMPKA